MNMTQKVNESKNLVELAELLNQFGASEADYDQQEYKNLDLSNLPTFGGAEPTDTDGIFSWDQDNYLIAGNDWEVISREEYEAE
jgi:hypothetical protein